jgi:Flp pilus assembly protein TadG
MRLVALRTRPRPNVRRSLAGDAVTGRNAPGKHAPGTNPRGKDASQQGARGQSLVEFSLVLIPLMLLLLGIVQFGFIFNSYVTLANASREAAREGTIYIYDRNMSKAANDLARNERIRTTLLTALNGLSKSAPQFANSSSWTSTTANGITTFVTGDLTLTYDRPTNVTDTDARTGWRITVQAVYRQDLYVPIISSFLPADAGGRLPLTGVATMVVN